MTCSGSYASFEDFAAFWCIKIPSNEEAHINRMLAMASTPIHLARRSNGACDCTLDEAAETYLMQLACILAATTYNCKCTNLRLTPEEKRMYMEGTVADLALIRTGKTELCAGETGSDFPSIGWAEQGVTEWARRDIIVNDILRSS